MLADFDTIFDANSRKITIYGGKFGTPSPGEFVVSGIIAFIAFVILRSFCIDTEKRNWADLYHKGVVDKSEYYKNRFNFF
ncbi:MAG: hypothetical protein AB1480_16110 [Nitrospirota bacterium]